MSRQNNVFLYARVSKPPIISKNDLGEYNYGMVYLDTVRSPREFGLENGVHFSKHDHPLVFSREKEIIDRMLEWDENSIVYVKGVVSTKRIVKSSYCPNCKDDNGNASENKSDGNLVYVTPIFVETVKHHPDKDSAIEDLMAHRELSNQIFILGTVLRDPKFITTKQGIQIAQYPIAINRKYQIRTDDPSIRTDWPIVKSYGPLARDDKTFVKYQSDVIIDGFLQARTVTRKLKCACCGKEYEWKDQCMEIVPYATEYVSGYNTKEDIENEYGHSVEVHQQILYDSGHCDELEPELESDDIKNDK